MHIYVIDYDAEVVLLVCLRVILQGSALIIPKDYTQMEAVANCVEMSPI